MGVVMLKVHVSTGTVLRVLSMRFVVSITTNGPCVCRPSPPPVYLRDQVVDAGMRVMRINFSHATFEEAEKRLTNLRAVR